MTLNGRVENSRNTASDQDNEVIFESISTRRPLKVGDKSEEVTLPTVNAKVEPSSSNKWTTHLPTFLIRLHKHLSFYSEIGKSSDRSTFTQFMSYTYPIEPDLFLGHLYWNVNEQNKLKRKEETDGFFDIIDIIKNTEREVTVNRRKWD